MIKAGRVLLIGLFGLAIGGCVARTQEFHCVLSTDSSQSFEMAMTPTSIIYRSAKLSFQEESGVTRTYRSSDRKTQVQFNTATAELTAQTDGGTLLWGCKKYEPLDSKQ